MVLWRSRLTIVALGAGCLLAFGLAGVSQAGHVRPKGATPVYESLVPAFQQCAVPNATHNGPVAVPSCNPPVKLSPNLTTGTPTVNGLPANMTSAILLQMLVPPAVGAPDLRIQMQINDVYCDAITSPCTNTSEALDDFVGGLNVQIGFRITDQINSVGGMTNVHATVIDFPVDAPVSCNAVTGGPPGGQCLATTTMNAIIPGSVPAGTRAVWEISRLVVQDGGSDGNPATTPNDTFLVRGLFQP